ncbi:SH3 domain-containing protein [Telmatospirillum sp.]|uniref:SH3 domain-containing protein n=1 Tax=Telmatospirillum sp. TaxID=2079197 RepID=UPI00284C8BCC|nr:SH3 domain-containing protein [Telmatospirillum sp.]MDR3437856.1 SH3 domain-containing protein [Telmatospirillum sp.]
MKYIATGQHRTGYPEPISFAKGTLLSVGEKYEGPEGWDNWYFCTTLGQPGGWVPAQIINRTGDAHNGIALEDYTARELEVNEGDLMIGLRSMNGWMWCSRLSDDCSGWVPLELLEIVIKD